MSLFPHRQLLSKLSVAQKGNEEVISSPGNTVVYLYFILSSCLYVFLEQSMNLSILGIKWIKCGGANFSAGAGRLMDLDENLEQRQGIGSAGTSWEEAGSFHRG